MRVIIEAELEEIAALVLAVQGQHGTMPAKEASESERESMIRQYESRLAKLKAGESPRNVIF